MHNRKGNFQYFLCKLLDYGSVDSTNSPLDRIGIRLSGKYFAGSCMMTRLCYQIDMSWYDM